MSTAPPSARQAAPDGPRDAARARGARRHVVTLANRGGREILCRADEPIIDACEAAGLVLPIACRYGGCITCAARLLSGRVRQPNATALNGRQSRAGYVLLCVARPVTDCTLEVGVESHGALYENPFRAVRRER